MERSSLSTTRRRMLVALGLAALALAALLLARARVAETPSARGREAAWLPRLA